VSAGSPADTVAGGHRLVLVRHGETEWSRSGRHTGRTDLPLLEEGRAQARAVGRRLRQPPFGPFASVLSSPLARAWESCALAGLAERAEPVDDLMEWDYGRYEGLRTAEIRAARPDWSLWCDGAPGGETADEVGVRADRIVARARATSGDVVAFGHGHQLRVLAARWVGTDARAGRWLLLAAGSVSVLGWERETPAIARWNDDGPWPEKEGGG